MTFETDSWDDDKIGKVALWSYGAVDEALNHIHDILEWFQIVKPNPTEKDKCVQLGAHFEEVFETMVALGVIDSKTDVVRIISNDFYLSEAIDKDSLCNYGKMLDVLCHQIVTTVGVAYMMGLDIMGALNALTEGISQEHKQ